MKKLLSILLIIMMLVPQFGAFAEETYTMPKSLVSDEKVTLTYMACMHAQQTNLDDYQYIADLEAATNVHLDATWVPNGQWTEKKNTILASGVDELPDIIHTVSKTDIATYAPQGYFVALDEYISEEMTPNLVALFAQYPEYKAALTQSDGHIYSLPSINMLPFRQSPFNMFINKEWLDRLNMEIPTNYEEFYNVLCAFRDNDANGNGDPTDEIPMAGNFEGGTDYFRWTSLFAMFGFTFVPGNKSMMYVTDDDRVTIAPLEEGFDTALSYFKKLYDERLLDNETFTQDNSTYTAKGAQSTAIYGVYFDWFGNAVTQDNFSQYTVLEPMAGPDNIATWSNWGTAGFYGGGGTVISAASDKIVESIKWLDYLYMPEISLQTTRGNIGVIIFWDEETQTYYYKDTDDYARVMNVPAEAMPFAFMKEMVAKVILPDNMMRKINEYYPINQKHMAKNYLPSLNFTIEESADIAIYETDIVGYITKMVPAFITGQRSIETEFADFVNQLKKMGTNEYLAIYQSVYDRFREAQ